MSEHIRVAALLYLLGPVLSGQVPAPQVCVSNGSQVVCGPQVAQPKPAPTSVPATAPASSPTASSGSGLSSNWFGAGIGYNSFATPNLNGWAADAWKISNTGPLYSWNGWIVNSARTHPFTVQTTAISGLAITCRAFGPVTIYCFLAPGISASQAVSAAQVPQSSTTLGFSLAYGGMAVWSIGKTKWTLEAGVMPMHTANSGNQTAYLGGVGRSFP